MSIAMESTLSSNALLLFKRDLLQELRELKQALDHDHQEIRALLDSDRGDVIDASCDNSAKEAVFATYSQNQARLRRVETALQRIATSDFGVCSTCGGPISFKRLQALPWTNTCIECQSQAEHDGVQ